MDLSNNIKDSLLIRKKMDSKTPGPDGLPGHFYHTYWPEVGKDVLKATVDILNHNKPTTA